jgi:hypothetical protein
MQRKKTFSAMEITLLIFLAGFLIASFLQARQTENEK